MFGLNLSLSISQSRTFEEGYAIFIEKSHLHFFSQDFDPSDLVFLLLSWEPQKFICRVISIQESYQKF